MSRLAIEFKAGVFVANINARVREKLWQRVKSKWNLDALMIYTTNNEQGYGVLKNGDPSRDIMDCEGIYLTHLYKGE
jgi:CRISPR-associated protein Cas2